MHQIIFKIKGFDLESDSCANYPSYGHSCISLVINCAAGTEATGMTACVYITKLAGAIQQRTYGSSVLPSYVIQHSQSGIRF
jgi:hypothetical protein